MYRIVQNYGGIKLWRIDRVRVLARKMLAKLQQLTVATLVNLVSKVLANDVRCTKFAKNFSPPKFCAIWYIVLQSNLYRITNIFCVFLKKYFLHMHFKA